MRSEPVGTSRDLAFSADGALVAFGQSTAGRRREVWDVAKRSLVASMEGGDNDSTALPSPSAPTAACSRSVASTDPSCASGTSSTRKLVHELDQGGTGAFDARVQPGWPDPRRLRLRACRVALGRCHRSPDRPGAHRRGPQDGDRSFPRRTRACWRPTATAKGLSGTSTPSRGRGVPARSPTAR